MAKKKTSTAVVSSELVRRRSNNWKHNLHLLETVLTLQRNTLEQIATSGKNSTRDRRNARATIRFVNALLEANIQEPPNVPDEPPATGDSRTPKNL